MYSFSWSSLSIEYHTKDVHTLASIELLSWICVEVECKKKNWEVHPLIFIQVLGRALPDITFSPEVRQIFKFWTFRKPDVFLPGHWTFKNKKKIILFFNELWHIWLGGGKGYFQCWTEGRSSTAVAEDLRPTATAMVAEVWGHSYGRRSYL